MYTALLLYEYAITLPQEIHTVWHRKKITAASLLLVSVRYVMLALAVVQLLHGQKVRQDLRMKHHVSQDMPIAGGVGVEQLLHHIYILMCPSTDAYLSP